MENATPILLVFAPFIILCLMVIASGKNPA